MNNALHRMGYADQLTGHGMRATISTALHELGYPKNWIDAQLSHADPDQVSATYNHARYIEQRRTMMQDWANRLDLWAQDKHEAASSPLTIRLEGTASIGAASAWIVWSFKNGRERHQTGSANCASVCKPSISITEVVWICCCNSSQAWVVSLAMAASNSA